MLGVEGLRSVRMALSSLVWPAMVRRKENSSMKCLITAQFGRVLYSLNYESSDLGRDNGGG